jgi:hypothetical protein
MKKKAFISAIISAYLFSSGALAYCGDNWGAPPQDCPGHPTLGDCANNGCVEGTATVPASGGVNKWVFGAACIAVNGDKKIKNVGWGLYPNDAGGGNWAYLGITSQFLPNGQNQFCIKGGNLSHNVDRPMFIRVWFDD